MAGVRRLGRGFPGRAGRRSRTLVALVALHPHRRLDRTSYLLRGLSLSLKDYPDFLFPQMGQAGRHAFSPTDRPAVRPRQAEGAPGHSAPAPLRLDRRCL